MSESRQPKVESPNPSPVDNSPPTIEADNELTDSQCETLVAYLDGELDESMASRNSWQQVRARGKRPNR
ncbi:MAG: hypothetical protein CMJ78_10280 [Planctomycetaceae bacterium]|nr:hypothetical protein [Planctomycetaceae bacterium]